MKYKKINIIIALAFLTIFFIVFALLPSIKDIDEPVKEQETNIIYSNPDIKQEKIHECNQLINNYNKKELCEFSKREIDAILNIVNPVLIENLEKCNTLIEKDDILVCKAIYNLDEDFCNDISNENKKNICKKITTNNNEIILNPNELFAYTIIKAIINNNAEICENIKQLKEYEGIKKGEEVGILRAKFFCKLLINNNEVNCNNFLFYDCLEDYYNDLE